ncbi:MAG: hypothetical protein HY395_00760 [Candidatus Doudnabacteria bacterium]|nr:hypothetical protein [Candidatus Doudnabacteria bacterium]
MKNKDKYGSFRTKEGFWTRNIKLIKLVGISLLPVLIVGGALLAKRNKKLSQVAEIPAAQASEMPGWWYQDYFGDAFCERPDCAPDADPDADKLTNKQEFYYHTDPLDARTVDDSMTDGELVARGFDPSRPGQVTFEEVMSEDNIMAESLLLEKDIRDLANEGKDISRVSIPLIPQSQLNIVYNQSADAYVTYSRELNNAVDKYFDKDQQQAIRVTLESGGDSEISDIKFRSYALLGQLKKMTVPYRMLTYHQYVMAVYQLMPEVLDNSPEATDISNPASDRWFANAQALFAVTQKLNFEQQRLELSLKTLQ